MANRLNPAEKTAAESDYEEKFNRHFGDGASDKKDLKAQEAAGDADWKTTAKVKKKDDKSKRKGRFGFIGRQVGRLRQGSAFVFIIAMLGLGVWYTSVFAPNILLVNVKEMYTNDLADATIALNTYYWKMMNYKIGRSNCGEKDSIKCKMSTMSRAQKQAFERKGFTVLGQKVEEDNKDDGQPGNEKVESRYQVMAIIPPTQSPGVVATGDMLWMYSELSSANKALVYSVFNPKSSFFMDTRFKQRIKSKYGLTKSITVGGITEQQVNKSFDSSVKNGGGIDPFGRPDPENGISLGALSSPVTLAQLETAMMALTNIPGNVNSFGGLQCTWHAFGKAVTNNAKSAKSATVARFAMQYLKAADQIKAGTSEDITISTMSSKLAQSPTGDYSGQSATDASMYKSIVYGSPPLPSIFGPLYQLHTIDLILAMVPAWSQIMASAAAQGQASKLPGQLGMPPSDIIGSGTRDYCLEAEKMTNHQAIKDDMEGQCIPQVTASAPPGWQAALEHAQLVARETCNPPHDHREHEGPAEAYMHGEYLMQPAVKATATTLSPYVAGIFGANAMVWANALSLAFTSQTKGVAASDAIFAGTGEILGDMAQSRGMMPGNVASMAEYLMVKNDVEKDFDDVARYNARKDPFDPYNKFSFIGSIVRGLSPTYNDNSPLLATVANSLDILGSSIKRLNPSANAIYYLQPAPFNPARLAMCPDPEYLAILITADVGCNVRYSMSRLDLIAQVDTVIDYMTKEHSDAYQDAINELTERVAQADDEIERQNVGRMLAEKEAAAQQPFIDDKTGRPIRGGEYEKFLDYCVNRQDPWGRSGIHVVRRPLTEEEIRKRHGDKTHNLEGISPQDSGDPYQRVPEAAFPAATEGWSGDQDWYTGKKCLEQSEMLTNFRAWTMACSVDGSLSGGIDCTDPDNSNIAGYSNDFFTNNDILYTSG